MSPKNKKGTYMESDDISCRFHELEKRMEEVENRNYKLESTLEHIFRGLAQIIGVHGYRLPELDD
jgi:hypothetical protein